MSPGRSRNHPFRRAVSANHRSPADLPHRRGSRAARRLGPRQEPPADSRPARRGLHGARRRQAAAGRRVRGRRHPLSPAGRRRMDAADRLRRRHQSARSAPHRRHHHGRRDDVARRRRAERGEADRAWSHRSAWSERSRRGGVHVLRQAAELHQRSPSTDRRRRFVRPKGDRRPGTMDRRLPEFPTCRRPLPVRRLAARCPAAAATA